MSLLKGPQLDLSSCDKNIQGSSWETFNNDMS